MSGPNIPVVSVPKEKLQELQFPEMLLFFFKFGK